MAQVLQIVRSVLLVWVWALVPSLLLAEETPPQPVEFFVVIPSYNNCMWCEKNLESVFSQTYQNWKLFYVDDCSTDGTGFLVDRYVKARGMEQKCTVLHNPERRGAMANLYYAISQTAPRTVVVDLDGDDYLSDDAVLQTLADVYKDPAIWLTYGSYQYEPGGYRGVGEPLPKEVLDHASIRSYQRWVTSQLRTFYAALFHNIKKEDLMRDGHFFEIASDVALFIPMLEMASHGHIRYIDRIMYIYNYTNPLSDTNRRELQRTTDVYIRTLKPYEPLDQLFASAHKVEARTPKGTPLASISWAL
jgi:glycosyltransferase involved in cell wall biosynthesis